MNLPWFFCVSIKSTVQYSILVYISDRIRRDKGRPWGAVVPLAILILHNSFTHGRTHFALMEGSLTKLYIVYQLL